MAQWIKLLLRSSHPVSGYMNLKTDSASDSSSLLMPTLRMAAGMAQVAEPHSRHLLSHTGDADQVLGS